MSANQLPRSSKWWLIAIAVLSIVILLMFFDGLSKAAYAQSAQPEAVSAEYKIFGKVCVNLDNDQLDAPQGQARCENTEPGFAGDALIKVTAQGNTHADIYNLSVHNYQTGNYPAGTHQLELDVLGALGVFAPPVYGVNLQVPIVDQDVQQDFLISFRADGDNYFDWDFTQGYWAHWVHTGDQFRPTPNGAQALASAVDEVTIVLDNEQMQFRIQVYRGCPGVVTEFIWLKYGWLDGPVQGFLPANPADTQWFKVPDPQIFDAGWSGKWVAARNTYRQCDATPIPTDPPTPTATAIPTNSPVPPTSTRTPTATPTNTAVPSPTPTPTQVLNQPSPTATATNISAGSIMGQTFIDLNEDGIRQNGEPDINGIVVTANGSSATSGEFNYEIVNLQPGQYTVAVDANSIPAWLEPSGPQTRNSVVNSGQQTTGVDFGFKLLQLLCNALTGYPVWAESNGDQFIPDNTQPDGYRRIGSGNDVVYKIFENRHFRLFVQCACTDDEDKTTMYMLLKYTLPGNIQPVGMQLVTNPEFFQLGWIEGWQMWAKSYDNVFCPVDNPTPTPSPTPPFQVPLAILELDKNGPPIAEPGQRISYTHRMTNTGSADAFEVIIIDQYPSGLIPVEDENWSCDGEASECKYLLESLAVGEVHSITFNMDVPNDHQGGPEINNSCGNHEIQPVVDDVCDSHTVTITTPISPANLIITKTALTDTVRQGGQIKFLLEIINTGQAAATNVYAAEYPPTGTVLLPGSLNWTQAPTGTWTVPLADIPGGGRTTMTVTLAVNQTATAGPKINDSCVSWGALPQPFPVAAQVTPPCNDAIFTVTQALTTTSLLYLPLICGPVDGCKSEPSGGGGPNDDICSTVALNAYVGTTHRKVATCTFGVEGQNNAACIVLLPLGEARENLTLKVEPPEGVTPQTWYQREPTAAWLAGNTFEQSFPGLDAHSRVWVDVRVNAGDQACFASMDSLVDPDCTISPEHPVCQLRTLAATLQR